MTWTPWRFFLVAIAGWMNRQQQEAISYLREENRILREKLGQKRTPETSGYTARRLDIDHAAGTWRERLPKVKRLCKNPHLVADPGWHQGLAALEGPFKEAGPRS